MLMVSPLTTYGRTHIQGNGLGWIHVLMFRSDNLNLCIFSSESLIYLANFMYKRIFG